MEVVVKYLIGVTTMKKTNYKILFADLDGTLITTASGKTFPEGIWDMKLRFDVLDAIKKLSPEFVCIVTNQGGIARDNYLTLRSCIFKCVFRSIVG